MKEELFTANDGKKLACLLWDEADNPKAVVQLVHGMKENIRRYARFAEYLNKNGFIVFGDDHRAHGHTARSLELIGRLDGEKDLFAATASDEAAIANMLKERYNLPLLLFGHSYGSFLAQRCIELTDVHQAVCLCGSAKYPYIGLAFVRAVAWFCLLLKSPEDDAKFIEKFSFGRSTGVVETHWTTRDMAEVRAYQEDPLNDRVFAYGFYHALFKNLMRLHGRDMARIRKNLPMLLISGEEDVVGGKLLFIRPLYRTYRKILPDSVTLTIYGGAKHDLLHELNREEVFTNVLGFFEYSLNL